MPDGKEVFQIVKDIKTIEAAACVAKAHTTMHTPKSRSVVDTPEGGRERKGMAGGRIKNLAGWQDVATSLKITHDKDR